MNLSEFLSPEAVLSDLEADNKVAALTELVQGLIRTDQELDPDQLVKILLEREKLGSTGIGDGIAIPHGKVPGLEQLLICFGRSQGGLDFDSMDGRPTHLFFLLLAPENSTGSHLTALAKLSRMLKNKLFRENLLKAEDAAAIHRMIISQGEEE